MKTSKKWIWIYVPLTLIAVATGMVVTVARGPNQNLQFSRDVLIKSELAKVEQNIDEVENWRKWFFNADEIKVINLAGQPYSTKLQKPTPGVQIRFHMDPHKGPWRQFDIVAVVTQYVPGRIVHLKIIKDTSGRLSKLFDQLEWQIEVVDGKRLRGSAMAHTAHWKARVFGHFTQKILMNQVFYPDLLRLAGAKPAEMSNPMMPPNAG